MSWQRMGGLMAIIYAGLAIMPLFVGGVDYMMHILIMILIWAVVASCWDLIMGFAGIFSFGQVAFFVIGAYASAIVSNKFGIPPFFSIFIAGGIAAILGVLVGLPCLRLKGAYVALVTFAVHMILEPFLKGSMGRAIGTGGSRGILTIPPIKIFGFAFTPDHKVAVFYLTLVLAVICSVIILMVIRSFWGTAFLALKDSEDFSASLGVSAFKYKLAVFALTSFLTGMVGGFYAHYVGMLSTRMLGIDLFVTLMIMLVIGGHRTVSRRHSGRHSHRDVKRNAFSSWALQALDSGGAGGGTGAFAARRGDRPAAPRFQRKKQNPGSGSMTGRRLPPPQY